MKLTNRKESRAKTWLKIAILVYLALWFANVIVRQF